MNLGLLFIFLIIQVVVNNVLKLFIPLNTIYGLLAFNLLSCLIISFVGAIFSTPPGYKKEFYKQPAFHKTMLFYFIMFFAIDSIFLLFR